MEEEHKKILCECGCFVRSDGLFRHQNTKKHIYLEYILNDPRYKNFKKPKNYSQ